MFTDPQKKKREFKKRVSQASWKYSLIIQDSKIEMNIKNFNSSNFAKYRDIENVLKNITRWNIEDVEREVEDYEEYCENVVNALTWFLKRYGDMRYSEWNQILLTHVNPILLQIPEDLRRPKTREVYSMAGKWYFKMLSKFQVEDNDPSAFQNRICIEIENEAKLHVENHLKATLQNIENEKRRKEEHAYNTAVAQKKVETDAQIDVIKQNYDTQVAELQQNFELQLRRVREEFQEKLSREVERKYQEDKPAQMELWRNELIARQSQFIEEEVSKRLKNQFNETLNRKEAINQETINLNTLKYEQAIKKLESEYQEHIKKIESTYEEEISEHKKKIEFLDSHLKETIVRYEKLFKERYDAEIEKRAKILAKEYLQKDFPFE